MIYSGTCAHGCNGGCRFKIKVRDGKVVQTSKGDFPDPAYDRICLKGHTHLQRIYGDFRLKYPLKRVGERGAGEWERLTWDEAITEITDKWKSIIAEHGPMSLLFTNGGLFAGSLLSGSIAPLLGSVKTASSDDFSMNMMMPLTFGSNTLYGMSEPKDLKNAKTIVVWAANITDSQLQQYHFVADAIEENGAELIVIDPNYVGIAAKADWWLPVKPTTDGALALGACKYLIDQDKVNKESLAAHSVAPLLVKKSDKMYLRASEIGLEVEDPKIGADGSPIDPLVVVDVAGNPYILNTFDAPTITGTFTIAGIEVTTAFDLLKESLSEWTLEKASAISEVPQEDIIRLAEIFTRKDPVAFVTAPGTDHYWNGHTNYYPMFTLPMLTGQVGRPGCGLFFVGYNAGPNLNWGFLTAPTGQVAPLTIPLVCINDAIKNKEFNGTPLDIKGICIWAKDVVGGQVNRQARIETFNDMEIVVVADVEMNDTALYADYVLPISHPFETEDILCFATPHQFIIFQDKCIEPLYECKDDFEAIDLLLKGMDIDLGFTKKEFISKAFDTDMAREAGISYESLQENKIMNMLPESMLNDEGLFVLGNNGAFNTPTGRVQFYQETVKPRIDTGVKLDLEKERLPHWEPPLEVWDDSPEKAKYPLILLQKHAKWRVHSNFALDQWLRELEGDPAVYLSPGDAESRSISNDDIVKVYNNRGFVVLKGRIDCSMRPGMINLPHGFRQAQYVVGHPTDLSHSRYNPYSVNNIFVDAAVEVEKYSQ